MVIFITESEKHEFSGLVLNSNYGVKRVKNFLNKKRTRQEIVVKDYEANGLCPIKNDPLLLALGDREQQFVIDCYTVDMSWLKDYDDLTYLGQNIKYDASMSANHYDCKARNLLCTMVIDQKLYQNNRFDAQKDREGFKYGLNDIIQRHLGFTPPETDKRIRNYFIDLKPSQARYQDKHINYVSGDIKYLLDVYDSQMKHADKWGLRWWLLEVECPLISVLYECENTGFDFDQEQWRLNIKENKILQHKYASELDEEFRRLRDSFSTGERKLVGGIWDRKRNFIPEIKPIGLFGEMKMSDFTKTKGYSKKSSNANINWGSSDTILKILSVLGLPAPLQGEAFKKYGYLIPMIADRDIHDYQGKVIEKKGNLVKHKGFAVVDNEKVVTDPFGISNIMSIPKYNEKGEGWTVGKVAWQSYLVDFPNTPLRHFISLLGKYSKVTTELTNFGENYLDKVNPITGRIHTIYRQATAANGRLQSGGGRKMPERYNSQNIPRDKKFRHCFKGGLDKNGDPFTVVTNDLSGAEVTFMCDGSNDEKLFEWAVINDDSHSPMVQNVWRHIYLYRAGIAGNYWTNFDSFKKKHKSQSIIKALKNSNGLVRYWYDLSQTFVVSKKENKPFRQAGKNGTFAGIYGAKPKRQAQTFNGTDNELMKAGIESEPVNVTEEEGKVINYAQKKAIPKTYAMVEDNVRKGMTQGFIVLNNRSKSRIWLPAVIRLKWAIKEEMEKMGITHYRVNYNSWTGYTVEPTDDVYELEWYYKKDYEGQLRNIPISGTQADCLKEAMVEIAKYVRKNNLEEHGVALLSQVHDELVYRCPKYMDGKSKQWMINSKRKSVTFKFDNPISVEDYKNKYKDEHCLNVNHVEDLIYSVECSFPKFVQLTMIKCANRFLKNFEMKASMDIMDSWTK